MPRVLPIAIATLAATGLAAGPAQAIDHLGQIGAPGAPGPTQLEHPWAVATGEDGRVYVTDVGTHRVSVFDSAGAPLLQFGSLTEPSGLAVDGGQVVVADRAAGLVRRFSSYNGVPLSDLGGGPGTGAGQFQLPTSVALGPNHELVVASKGRITRFDGAGTYLQQRLASSGGPGSFKGLAAVTVAPAGQIYASDTADDKIERYSATLAYQQMWSGYTAPTGLAFDAQAGTIWVADRIKGVSSVTATGAPVGTLGAATAGDGQLTDPAGIAVDCRGTVYVADQLAGRVQKYGSPAQTTPGNLLVNGSFEQGGGSCSALRADRGAGPGWSNDGSTTAVHYGAADGFPTRAAGDSLRGGESLLAGGGAAVAVAEQDIDVSGQALDIDDGRRAVNLSGLLGGRGAEGDTATVEAIARDGAGAPLGTLALAPVTAADRAGKTTLLPRAATATLPAGTRSIRVRVVAAQAPGGDPRNDGYVDGLALTLTPQKPAAAPPATGASAPSSAPSTPPSATTKARVTFSLVNATGLLKTRRLTVRVACDQACATTVTARVAGRLLTGRAVRKRAGATRVNWRLTSSDVAKLKARRSPTVRVVVRGGRRTVTHTFAVS